MFCSRCHSLMFPVEGRLACSNPACGSQREVAASDVVLTKVQRTKKEHGLETLVVDELTQTMPRTKVECPKCGHGEAFWVMRQTRAADEPTTRIYRCTRCSNTWREF
jgi:DNA-directed RNA polymerase subunit M